MPTALRVPALILALALMSACGSAGPTAPATGAVAGVDGAASQEPAVAPTTAVVAFPTAVAVPTAVTIPTAVAVPTAVTIPTAVAIPTVTVAPSATPEVSPVAPPITPNPPTPPTPPTAVAPAGEADSALVQVANGAEVYVLSCARCHGGNGLGTAQYSGLAGAGTKYSNPAMIQELTTGHPVTFGFADRLSADEIASVVAYVRASFP